MPVLILMALLGAADAADAQPELSLSAALALARTQSPALAAARARVDGARDARDRSGRFLNPLLEVRSENWASGAPGGLPLDVFATVTQSVELGGKRGDRRALATAAMSAAIAAAAIAWRDVARAVVNDYLTAVRAREHAAERSAFAIRLADATRVMQRRVEVGSAPEADLLKLRTEEARAVLERTRAEMATARALASLSAALGQDVPAAALGIPDVPPLPADGAEVTATHPELQAAAGAVEVARAAVDVERSRALPDVGIIAGMKRTAGFNTGVAAVVLPVPLFDRNFVARSLAEGQLRAAERDRDAVRQRLRGALRAASQAATTLLEHDATVQPTLVTPAREAREAARAAFGAGALDVLRLVDAERLYLDAATVAADLRIDAVAAAVEARLAVGQDPLP